MSARGVNVRFGDTHVIRDVSLDLRKDEVVALIGPSGAGKSVFLRCFNRMNDEVPGCRVSGEVRLDETDVYGAEIDPSHLRARVGMVFQRPNAFPMSVYDNVAYGARIHGLATEREALDALVEQSLQRAGLWAEVQDRLDAEALALSEGQQQRLCIARALAVDPEVILMDEPCSALDRVATAKIEEWIVELRGDYAIALVTQSIQQAARVSQRTAFFDLGELVEEGATEQIFTDPHAQRTSDYITGRYG